MTLNELITELQNLALEGNGDLSVYATHGASGACDEVGNPFVRQTTGEELGELCDEEVGTPYVDIYIGN
tara:strand:+ start:148084 stop:148290 length:207 start_codon:yes stop_codon:yes gene_type:complete